MRPATPPPGPEVRRERRCQGGELSGADIAFGHTADGWAEQARTALGGLHRVFGRSAGDGPVEPDPGRDARGIVSRSAPGPAMPERFGGGMAGMRQLETLSPAQAAAGSVVPLVQWFPLREAAEAHRALETRGTVGKVVPCP